MELPPFSSSSFINREAEITLVSGKVHQLRQGMPVRPRTLIFRGERGVGKTWLCLHLKRTVLANEANVDRVLISLARIPLGYSAETREWFLHDNRQKPDEIVLEIARWLADQLQTTTARDAEMAELGYWLPRDIGARPDRLLVLFIDSAYEADWNVLTLLENHLLGALAALPNVLIVITGRGRPFPWTSPLLRIDAAERFLEPFDVELVRKQLALYGLDGSLAEEILQQGGGHPLLTYLLAAGYGQPHRLDDVVSELLSVLPSPAERERVRRMLEALCVLDGFVEDDIAPMYAARQEDPSIEQWSMARVREERDLLLRSQLVQWRDGSFVIDRALRSALDAYLRQEAPVGFWQRLQERAVDLYVVRATKYEKYRNISGSVHLSTVSGSWKFALLLAAAIGSYL